MSRVEDARLQPFETISLQFKPELCLRGAACPGAGVAVLRPSHIILLQHFLEQHLLLASSAHECVNVRAGGRCPLLQSSLVRDGLHHVFPRFFERHIAPVAGVPMDSRHTPITLRK